jgi:hypothetical protein
MKYYSIHFKKKGKSKGFISIRPAASESEVFDYAKRASFGSRYFPDMESIKEVSEKRYKKFIDKTTK